MNSTLKAVTLPEIVAQEPRTILQNSSALGVTSATAALYEYITTNFGDSKLRVLEAGSGSGILCIMLNLIHPHWDITGLEIQAALHSLAQANADALKVTVRLLCADLCSYADKHKYDLIVSNPPWQKAGQGLVSPKLERAICRTELYCTMPELLAFCWRNLNIKQHAVLLYPVSRRQELLTEAGIAGLELINSVNVDKTTMVFHLQKG
ncbi:MAG: methyltransferase [Candidatus Cloacimonetes bacterium]|nr:methyltransferase [Candidatus Cloacimonadota bacterium]